MIMDIAAMHKLFGEAPSTPCSWRQQFAVDGVAFEELSITRIMPQQGHMNSEQVIACVLLGTLMFVNLGACPV